MQVGEPYNHASMTDMVDLAMSGAIERVGFVKVGMAETYARRGVPTATLLNYVRTPPAVATPRPVGVRPSIGVWSVAPVWRKIPYAMVAACADLRTPPILHASGADPTLAGLAAELGVELHLLGAAVPHDEMARWLAAMDLNLYVTLSECAPMLPLESLAVGVPCLIGPNTHYFDDDPYLHARLVVAEPDRHDRIASAIERVLDERSAIIEHYRTHFYPRHAAAGRHSVLSFLGVADSAVA
jgi:glycosyltransferase involved in cell wall biosynthesis